MPKKPLICVIGLGYIGLPTAALLASKGYHVIGYDIAPYVVATINAGDVHLFEPDLDTLVATVVGNQQLSATVSIPSADIFIVSVPTPMTEDHRPDISHVKSAIKTLAPQLKKNNLIIIESTSPVGTTEDAAEWIMKLRPDLAPDDIYLAYCPERVLPGRILHELIHNDRVIGGINEISTEMALRFYQSFVKGDCIPTNARTAEMSKLTENAFRDVNIAFANELSILCDRENINVWELIALANRHPRVNILQPGPGVGGHCIAVDPWFLVTSHPQQAKLIRTAREVNDYKSHYVLENLLRITQKIEKPTIACLGIAFKKDIDDLRESPALKIVKQLAEKTSGMVNVVEPHIQSLPESLIEYSNITLMSFSDAIAHADLIVVLVPHSAFTKERWYHNTSAKIIDLVGIMEVKNYATNSSIA